MARAAKDLLLMMGWWMLLFEWLRLCLHSPHSRCLPVIDNNYRVDSLSKIEIQTINSVIDSVCPYVWLDFPSIINNMMQMILSLRRRLHFQFSSCNNYVKLVLFIFSSKATL